MVELVTDVKIAANGRMVLPRSVREALGIEGESRLILTVQDGELRLSPLSSSIARAQALYRAHARPGRSSDEFLADRERD
ncbi:AbrB/MazE/SpoVT family DNA-binding domain-containing protein [Aquamicrobium sp. LC103]|uniref:AbrB/MazE/SpoVT family DNA-binding domain-containing protein n=1 Tax=Aquamicrobium sp. LC103 TaxID=1120658 RepID=UPI00063EBABD|nr:AbrB/MazE/SpoVT family DNA-binding domain-containing protein [Aquamicrobium sp. LC103]TKT75389.1 AbrB/MazE/SpoVT family DNA-binding domain-containing protein [Aquamicrobium sp. LC103]